MEFNCYTISLRNNIDTFTIFNVRLSLSKKISIEKQNIIIFKNCRLLEIT